MSWWKITGDRANHSAATCGDKIDRMANLRSAQRELTRKLLLQSALDLFTARGFAATTIDEIAVGAGTTRTTFYVHFRSKEDVVLALIDDVEEFIVTSDNPPLTEVTETGRRAGFQAWAERRFEQWPTIMPVVMTAVQAAGSDPRIQERMHAWHHSAVDEMVAGMDAAGRFDPAERRTRAVLAFAQVEYLSRRWAAFGWGDDLHRTPTLNLLAESIHHLIGATD